MDDETFIRIFINEFRQINVKRPELYSVLQGYEELDIFSNFLKGYILNWNKESSFEDCLSKIKHNYQEKDVIKLHDMILFSYTEEYLKIMNINGDRMLKLNKLKKLKVNKDVLGIIISYL